MDIISPTIREKTNRIKFSVLIFLTSSLYFVGLFSTLLIFSLILISYIIGSAISLGYENFKMKDELERLKDKIKNNEEVNVIKEDFKDNSIEFKRIINQISDYDYFSKFKIPERNKKKEDNKKEKKDIDMESIKEDSTNNLF